MDNNRTSTVPIVPKQYRLPFFMLVSCFALWGLLNNMTDNLVPAFSKIFMINASESAGVQISFYGAYAVLAIFASILLEEFSYKAGVLIGLGALHDRRAVLHSRRHRAKFRYLSDGYLRAGRRPLHFGDHLQPPSFSPWGPRKRASAV